MLILALCWLQWASASSFAYGTMNWVTLGRNATDGTTQIKLIQNYAWRRNYAIVNWGYPTFPVYLTDCPEKSDPYYNGCPLATLSLVGLQFQIYQRLGPASYGTPIVSKAIDQFIVMEESRDYLALSTTSDVNWIRGFFLYDWTVPFDTQEYVVVFYGDARLSTLMDGNNDRSWLVTCNIKIYDNFYRTRSPSTTGSIREFLESCVESAFVVPRLASDGRAIATLPSLNNCSSTVPTGQFNGSSTFIPKSCLANSLPSLLCAANPIAPKLGIDGKLTWYPKLPSASDCSGDNANCQNRYTTDDVGCFWNQFQNRCERKDEYAIQFTLLEIAPFSLFITYDVIFEVSQFCLLADNTCNHAPHFSPRFAGPFYGTPNTPVDATYHKSVCGNPNATSCLCLRGVETVLVINAVDYDITQIVTATSSLLPFGASLSTRYLGQMVDLYDANTSKTWTTYTLKWIPPLDGVDVAICFQALDSQAKSSNGNYCLTLEIVETEYIYVSGLIRDFLANHSDFGRPEALADNGQQWIQSGLRDGKPTLNGVAVTTVTKFDDWFNTVPGVNEQTVFSTALVRLGTPDRFTYHNTNFLPINGVLYGNDNTQNYPARGNINSFFTYELHTYLAFNATVDVNFTFGSTDDMWLFINGVLVPNWTLHGIHPPQYQTIDLKQLYATGNPLQFASDTTLYRVDLFYADRSRNRTEPMIQIELSKAVLCDALSAGTVEAQFVFSNTYSALAGTNLYKIGATTLNALGLGLLNQSQSAAAVYIADDSPAPVPKSLRVLQGFQATFDFKISSGPTQGFAFVISSQPSVGIAGDQLGYGGLNNLIVIEFDTAYTAANGDPYYDHVTILGPTLNMTSGFSSTNITANHEYALGTSIYDPSHPEFGPQLTMNNGSVHHVRITYSPPQQDDTSMSKVGWLRVWMGQVIDPLVEVPIPAIFLANMLGSGAYVGFTSGAGFEATSKIFIQNLQFVTVPLSPVHTGVVNWVTSVVAGVVNTVMIQSRDACGNNMLAGANQDRYSAEIRVFSSNRLLTTAVTSFTTNNDGTYNFTFSCTKVGYYVVTLTFDGVGIVGSKAVLIVQAAPISRLQTRFVFGVLPVVPDNSLGNPATGLYMIAVRSSDGTILDRVQNDEPNSILAWLTSFGAGTIFGVVNVGHFNASSPTLSTKFDGMGCPSFQLLATSVASSWACVSNLTSGIEAFLSLEAVEVSWNFGKFVVVSQGDVSSGTSYLNVIKTSVPPLLFYTNHNYTVSVMAMDQYGNLNANQNGFFSLTFSPLMAGISTQLTPVSGSPGYYAAKVSATTASSYTMTIGFVSPVDEGNIDGIPASLTFLAPSTILVPYDPTNVTVVNVSGVVVVISPDPIYGNNGTFGITVTNGSFPAVSSVVSIVYIDAAEVRVAGLTNAIRFFLPIIASVLDPVAVCLGEEANFVLPQCGFRNTSTNTWHPDGCKTGVITSTQVECSCVHFTDFSFIAPQFNRVPAKQFLELVPANIQMYPMGLVTVMTVLVLFAIILAHSARKDVLESRHETELKLLKFAKWDGEEKAYEPDRRRRWWRRFRIGMQTHHTWGSVLCRRSGTSFRSVDRALVMLMSLLCLMSVTARFHDRDQSVLARGSVVVCTVLSGLAPNLILSRLFSQTGPMGFFEVWQSDRLQKSPKLRCLRYRFAARWRWVWYSLVLIGALGMILYILSIALMFDQNPAYFCRGETTRAWIEDFVVSYALSVLLVEPLKIIFILMSSRLREQLTTVYQKTPHATMAEQRHQYHIHAKYLCNLKECKKEKRTHEF